MRPSKKRVLKLFNMWRETGSILDKKELCLKRAFTEHRFEDIRVRMEISPRKSSRRLAQECNMLKSSVLRGLKALKFHPYKVSLSAEVESCRSSCAHKLLLLDVTVCP
jgi:hypothetical protein